MGSFQQACVRQRPDADRTRLNSQPPPPPPLLAIKPPTTHLTDLQLPVGVLVERVLRLAEDLGRVTQARGPRFGEANRVLEVAHGDVHKIGEGVPHRVAPSARLWRGGSEGLRAGVREEVRERGSTGVREYGSTGGRATMTTRDDFLRHPARREVGAIAAPHSRSRPAGSQPTRRFHGGTTRRACRGRYGAARSAATRSAAVVAASGRQSGEVSCGGESAAIVTRPSGEGRTGDRGRWLG